jgi:transglycosylase-like protein with SLT domain
MRDRKMFAALVVGLLVVASLWPTTASVPALPAVLPAPPDAERVAMLEEIAYWMRGTGREFRLFGERPLTASASAGRRVFHLFGNANGAGRRQLLATLPYGALIEEAAQRYHLDSLLLAAVVQTESGFDARALSPQGAQGLMQLMPTTARTYGAHASDDPQANVGAGARYLRDLLTGFDGDVELALAAYNAGPAAVRRFRGVPPYRETRGYVERVLTLYIGYHRTLWRQAQLDQLLGDLPNVYANDDSSSMLASTLSAPSFTALVPRRSARSGRALLVGSVVVPAAKALTEVANPLAEPLAELRQAGVAEDQQHDRQDDQQLGDTKASEHFELLRGMEALANAQRSSDFSLADRPAPPATPAAAQAAAPRAPESPKTSAMPAPGSVPQG